MTLYRFYKLDLHSHIRTLPEPVECSDDDDAIEKAKERAKNCIIEIWDLKRRVAVIGRKKVSHRWCGTYNPHNPTNGRHLIAEQRQAPARAGAKLGMSGTVSRAAREPSLML